MALPTGTTTSRRFRPAAAGPSPLRPLVAGFATLASAGLVAVANPESNHLPLCPMRAITGLDCPLCGGLRAVQCLVRADVPAAASHNLLFVASLPLVLVVWAWWLSSTVYDGVRPPTAPRWALPASVVVLSAFTILRNLPALSWLASG